MDWFTLASILAPQVTNLIMHFTHPDGTTSLVIAAANVDAKLAENSQKIQALLNSVGTAIQAKT